MNCQDFESLAGDLARGVPAEARTREEARAHEAACPRCAARLGDERALSDGLRGLAATALSAAAPPRVEASLLAAFRAQAAHRAVEGAPAPAAEKVLPFARPSAPRRWSWMKTAAAAAAAAAAAIALFVLVGPPVTEPDRAALTPPVLPGTGAPLPPAFDGRTQEEDSVDAGAVPHPSDTPRAAGARPQRRLTATPAAYTGRATRPPRGLDAGREEIATSFIPLTQDAALAAAEGGQVVRVELPRTALERFGLPMNVERAGERVKADVLLSHDGVARAIRFVR